MNGDFFDSDEDETVRALRRAVGNEGAASEPAPGEGASAAAARLAERAAREELLDVAYASLDSPFGRLLVASTPRGLVRVAFPEESEDAVLERLARRLSPRILRAPGRLDGVARELDEYFSGARLAFETDLDWSLIGPFGRKVLSVTAAIPYGNVLSYAQVAGEAGSPRGSRAAGNALGSNPIPIVIPCHRVLRTSGNLGGYGGGLERKRWLLELEGALQPQLTR